MNISEFRATGKDVEDLSEFGSTDESIPGRRYAAGLYIERVDHPKGKWQLTIGNSGWLSDDLAKLEEELFQFGESEGALNTEPDPNDIQPLLCDLLRTFARVNGLEFQSAGDMRATLPMDAHYNHRNQWLNKYSELWDLSERYL